LFTVSVETWFWASHRLRLTDGAQEPLHQHNWRVTAEVAGDKLDRTGLVMDFRRLKTMLDSIVAGFDNAPLDELDCFSENNPSAENVARYVYDKLGPMLPDGLNLGCVRVVEQPGCSAKFNGD
jgi:6-pyruvoyltetrahydropterin/6-carboxytetrahydropterin synthase